MKLFLAIILFLNVASAAGKQDREVLWYSACEMILREDNPYKELSIDQLLALSTIKDQASWIELLIRFRHEDLNDLEKDRIRISLNKIFENKGDPWPRR